MAFPCEPTWFYMTKQVHFIENIRLTQSNINSMKRFHESEKQFPLNKHRTQKNKQITFMNTHYPVPDHLFSVQRIGSKRDSYFLFDVGGSGRTRTPAANDAHVRNERGHKNTSMNEPTDLLYIMQEMFLTGPTTRNDGILIIEKKVKRHKRTASICIYTRRDFATPNGNDRCHFLGGASFPRIIENTVFRFAFDDLIILAAPANQPNTRTHLTTNRLKTGLFAMLHRSSWCFCASENVHRSWALGNNYTETEADKHLFF